KGGSLDRLPTPGGLPRQSWDGIKYATVNGSVAGDVFLDFASPYTLLSATTAGLLGLPVIDTVDLSGNTSFLDELESLDELERAGFYSASAANFGVFGEAVLPTLDVTTDDGSVVQFSDVSVLINPVSTESLLGFRLFRSGSATVDGIP